MQQPRQRSVGYGLAFAAVAVLLGLVTGYVMWGSEGPDRPADSNASGETATRSSGFPTLDSTGPVIPADELTPVDSIVTERDGQVIEAVDVRSRIKVVHDDVTIRDVRITHVAERPGQYALLIERKNDGTCPERVLVERIEIRGDLEVLAPGTKAVYGACPFTLRDSKVHDVATGVRITDGSVLEGNYIDANFFEEGDDAHRSAVGLNGGENHRIVGNRIVCEGPGCSGALVMYGDFAQVQDVLIEGNLLATTGSYCTYAGSLETKAYPQAADVRYIGNTFGQDFFPECGRFGPVAGLDGGGGPGFVWEDNVWNNGEELTVG